MADLIEAGGRPPKGAGLAVILAASIAIAIGVWQAGNHNGAAYVALVGAIGAYAFARGK